MKILIVTTNVKNITEDIETGVWLEEFMEPYLKFLENNYNITIASPNGGISPVDPKSIKDEYKKYANVLNETISIKEAGSNYDLLYIPGGHGCMLDLPDNKDLAKIIEKMNENKKIISAICHGLCGLISAKNKDNTPFVFTKTLTSFTNEEENETGLREYMPFLIESKLKELGANYIKKPEWANFVVEDNRLITGQNQNSAKQLAKKLILKLENNG